MIMTEWKTYRLGDITIMRNGKKRPNTQGTYPVYGGNGIMDYADCYNAENTIIVGRVGAYCGNVYQCKNKCWVSDNAISVSANELVDDNYLYYFDDKDPDGLKCALREILDKPIDEISERGARSREFALENKSNASQAQRIIELIKDMSR
jgi:hypothetical protein